MSTKPLAEMAWVEDERGFGADVLRIGSETWPAEHLEALELAIDINAAHEAALAPLRGQLAMAREALMAAKLELEAHQLDHDTNDRATIERRWHNETKVVQALTDMSLDPPGEWVPLEKYQQLQAVLNDALEENGERMYRERCEKALVLLGFPGGLNLSPAEVIVNTSATPLEGAGRVLAAVLAILEGREPLPAHLDAAEIGKPLAAPIVLSGPRLPAIHRGGYTGDDEP